LAVVEIVILLAVIIATTTMFRRVSKMAAYLMLPYIAWVSFATVLSSAVWWLNRF